ncbi:MAG TPA: TolC family protein [Bacteroidales bacterium]|nr:TolC family protein [Bacteroidales bacterium]
MKRLMLFFLLIGQVSLGQEDTLDLSRCFEAVGVNHPGAGQKKLIDQQTLMKIQNLKVQWYPSLDMNARVSYQSDIARIQVDLPFEADFPVPSKDQYQVTLNMNQMIYDGGRVEASRKVQKAGEQVEKQLVEVDLYEIKDQVVEVYFSILLLNKQLAILESTRAELKEKRRTVAAAVQHGTLLPSDLKSLRAELLNLEQNIEEVQSHVYSAYGVLAELTGLPLGSQAFLKLPHVDTSLAGDFQRPENNLFYLKSEHLETRKKVVQSHRLPKISAFAQAGYGKPGLNMLGDEFDRFYMVGANLTWNIWDWSRSQRERQILQIEQHRVDIQERSFNKALKVQLARIEADIRQYRKAARRDEKIVSLRREVSESAKSKLENGVITSSDYIAQLNQLTRARITRERHKIALQKARFDYLFTQGIIP